MTKRAPAPRPFGASDLDRSIFARFDEVARARPAAPAVLSPRGGLTYDELRERAVGIAVEIASRLGAPEAPARWHAPTDDPAEPGADTVALLVPQGPGAIAAVLGALAAGCAYVPLDPRQPRALLEAAVRHSRARLVVTDSQRIGLAREVAAGHAEAVVAARLFPPATDAGATAPADPGADALAYVYYTSGSTGSPKGVMDTHRNVLHNVLRYTRALAIGPEDRLTLLQSPAFSGAVSSTFCALLNGAALCPYDLLSDDPERLADWMHDCGVTVYHSVPSIFRALVAGRRPLPALRAIRLEGDRALSRDVELFRASFARGCVLANGLGLTETGLVRQLRVTHDTPVRDGLLPVGYPVEGVEVEILGEDGRALPRGEPGEIVVRSRYLAPGYWRDPELTARKFLPAAEAGGPRGYRTGDLGRLREDGCLEYLGRSDFVLRVRGQAVDPAEVEQAIIAIDGVADAVVTARESANGEPELVAFVVPAKGSAPAPTDIRRALQERLPAHAVPPIVALRERLPASAFGKIDRVAARGLAAALGESGPRTSGGRAPRSETEVEIARIWCEVLRIDVVAADTHWLDCGGDSLSASRVLSRIERHFDRELPRADFLMQPTVADQARLVERADPAPRPPRGQPAAGEPPSSAGGRLNRIGRGTA